MRHLAGIATSILVVGTIAATPALADCAPFEVHGKGQAYEGTLIDHGDDGRNAGDIHVGSRGLANDQGETIGRVSWVNTSIDPDSAHSQMVMELADGDIHYSGRIVGLGGRRNEDTTDYDRITSVIHGGTGAYIHATGMVETIMEDDGPRYIVTVRCE